ncbi:MAG: 50S ribosomal protein L11 methyltransferase [Candidatus Korarchaeota archaeon]|nr:50S ribosomal protein L11 methyltransferase [Candidatus Korarchaeota archaeon]
MEAKLKSKKEVEILLEQLESIPNPKPELEQHTTPADLAAALVNWAWLMGDIEGKKIADLGCGNGILALASLLYGGREAVGIDIDSLAVITAWINAGLLGLRDKVRFYVGDVEEFRERADTVVQNPPFGVVRRHADLKFLKKSLTVAEVVYSIHMAGNAVFLGDFASKLGASLTHVERWPFPLKRVFPYHRRRVVMIPVEILRFEVRK